ncbi:regulatory protein LuxR [Kineococcus radiotolerans SRS30216 = ATCC BAA-149]|uniref:Regulatory protein LuxR n=1 Tax=Kineococcus radiotolerans (strain ATCC BAA-149 / DSM 14245 / SRS30216) TaxID=266940 RepID=A6WDL1_KINRD|nr:regulatory protein LuxR [Kineococcus radiotolerans SRS30216 = ATCC BAA-149]
MLRRGGGAEVRGVNRLHGRDHELRRAAAVLAGTRRSGGTGLLTVEGAPGIGKSTFLRAVAALARQQGYRVGSGSAEESSRMLPLTTLLSALRSGPEPLLSEEDFAELGGLYDRQPWLVERLADALAVPAAHGPVLVLLDDVQWSDQLSVVALRVVLGRLARQPVCWVLAGRPDPGGALDRVAGAARHLVTVSRLTLGPLDADAVEGLAREELGGEPDPALRRLLARAGGHPLLVSSLLAGWRPGPGGTDPAPAAAGAALPHQLILAVRHQLSTLPPGAVELLRTGAVLGRRFTLADVSEVTRQPAARLMAPLEEAVRAGLLHEDGDGVAFRHDLVRQAVHDDLPVSLRAAVHRDIAAVMTRQRRPAAHVAPHVLGQWPRSGAVTATPEERRAAADVLRAAAGEIARATPAAAADLLQRALDLLPPDSPERLDVGLEALTAAAAGLQVEAAAELGRTLLRGTTTAGDAARVWWHLARPLRALSADEELQRGTAQALAALPPGDDAASAPARLRLRAVHAQASSRGPDGAAAAEEARGVLQDALRLEDTAAAEAALVALAEAAAWQGRHHEALVPAREARLRHGGPPRSAEIAALTGLERYDEARALLAEAAEVHRSDAWETLPEHAWRRALLELYAGRTSLAQVEAEHLLRLGEDFEEFALYRAEAHCVLARIVGTRGDTATGRRHVEAARALLAPRNVWQRLTLHVVDGRLAEGAGDDRAAVAAFSRALDLRREHALLGAGPDYDSAPQIVRVALRAGAPALAEDSAANAAGYAERNPGVPGIQGIALHARALVDGDVDRLGEAVRVLATGPRVPVHSVAAGDLAALLAVARRRAEAVEAWRRASDALAAWGASTVIVDPRALALRSRGGRAEPAGGTRPVSGWEALTGAERRVAERAGRGGTNRSIAEELGVSPHTVSTHLRAVFGKLGINSRVQLAHVVATRPDAGELTRSRP